MMDFSEEYKFLRTELEINKKFVFERPLLIIGTGMAILGTLYNVNAIFLAPIPFLAILYYNLSFTNNRLKSSSRIIAYIQLVHEEEQLITPGWESALKIYRKTNVRKQENNQNWKSALRIYWKTNFGKQENNQNKDSDYDNLTFSKQIFDFHLQIGAYIATVMNFGALITKWNSLNWFFIFLFLINVASIFIYIVKTIELSLEEMHSEIERDRIRWTNALKKIEVSKMESSEKPPC
jgi:hypothetical protein